MSSVGWDPSLVPTYEQVMLPLLIFAKDKAEHRVMEALPSISAYLLWLEKRLCLTVATDFGIVSSGHGLTSRKQDFSDTRGAVFFK
jgi:hypothetical protein